MVMEGLLTKFLLKINPILMHHKNDHNATMKLVDHISNP